MFFFFAVVYSEAHDHNTTQRGAYGLTYSDIFLRHSTCKGPPSRAFLSCLHSRTNLWTFPSLPCYPCYLFLVPYFSTTIVLLLCLSAIIPVIQQPSHPAISVFLPFTHSSRTHSNIDFSFFFFLLFFAFNPIPFLKPIFIPPCKLHSFPWYPLAVHPHFLRRNFIRTLAN